jgi:hypothetical protein
MALDRVAGFPDYSSDAAARFVPAIWSGKLQVKHYDATVLTAISNTDKPKA